MAEDLDDGEFWLPPQFLTEEDLLMDFKKASESRTSNCFGRESDGGVHFPYGFNPFGPNSDLSSPVESVAGSTETESDEEDFLAGLTRKMAHCTLQDDMWKSDSGFHCEKPKLWTMSGSPQSTLCNVLGGCGCKQGCPSQVPSPPSPNRGDAALHMLYAAAEEVARMRILEGGTGFNQNRGQFGPPRKPCPVAVSLKGFNSDLGFHSHKYNSYQQLQAAQFQKLKQLQMLMKQQDTGAWGPTKGVVLQHHQQQQSLQMLQNRGSYGGGVRPVGLSMSTGTTLIQPQLQSGSGMRAVFLENHGTKRECAGTGVFLPRRIGSTTEPRKKPACSTVLLPERVVQALNLNLERIDTQPQLQHRYEKSVTPDYDAALKFPSNFLITQQRRNAVRPQAMVKNEVGLPQEWTY